MFPSNDTAAPGAAPGPRPFESATMADPQTPTGLDRSKVLVVDDHELVRMGVRDALRATAGDAVQLLEAATLADAMALYGTEPDIALVLLDLNMPDCRGLQGLRQFRDAYPAAQVLVVSGTQEDLVVAQAKALGAVGYVTKAQAPMRLAEIVAGLCGLERPGSVSPGYVPVTSQRFPPSARFDRVAELGARHLEILDLVLFGCSNQEISKATGLSLGTIKNYVSTILLAMDVKSRSHLISLFR